MSTPVGRPAKVRIRKPDAAPNLEKPTETVARAAINQVTVNDENGRRITVKKLLPSEKMRLMGVIGGEFSANQIFMGHATLAASVVELNGEIEPPFNTLREIYNLVDRLGDEGLAAVGAAHAEHFMTDTQLAFLRDMAKN